MKKTIILEIFGVKEKVTLDFSNTEMRKILFEMFFECRKSYTSFKENTDKKFMELSIPYLYNIRVDNALLKKSLSKRFEEMEPDEKFFDIPKSPTLVESIRLMFFEVLENKKDTFCVEIFIKKETPLRLILEKLRDSKEKIEGITTDLEDKKFEEYKNKLEALNEVKVE